MNTIVRIDISDETSYVTLGIIHFDKSHRVHYSTVGWCTCIVYCFRVSSKSIQS